ncbi:Glycosyltransferase involved in cell wall bisynthesis [Pseudonocardia ammonioxydans]|uniref:Glycosyltransferase involved in cell wall bisynthesis n=1 Tax=Pseudonocardia ammonioxydans TaxID=260086 RepID=A0A1I5AZC7_PSUAM|nr:glycosyltransferase [Pseudonocardia ammonioxydans]SFN67836.1 Glycosyltransferase involved in cell wall bisynthesis [Pseudonocardia ammonioxydans]
MRVLIGADTWAPDVNGASYAARRLAAGLAERGHEVHVVAPARGIRSRPARRVGPVTEHRVRSFPVPKPAGFRLCPPPGLRQTARRILRRVRPDVVHVQSHMVLGRMLLTAAADLGIPAMATTHMIPENIIPAISFLHLPQAQLKKLFWWDAVRVLERAGLVTAPTPLAASLAERNGVPGPVLPVSNGLDLSRFRPDTDGRGPAFRDRHGIPRESPLVGFVGRLDREKHVDEIVHALALLRGGPGRAGAVPDARLVVVGDGEQRGRLQAAARTAGVEHAVTFTGRLDDDEIPDVYTALDVFANAGTAELQSLVTLEAMATGKPVVAVDAGALPHLARQGENGWRYPHGDVAALADRLARVLGDPAAAAELGTASLRIAGEHSMATTLDTVEELYRTRVRPVVPVRAFRRAPGAGARRRVGSGR